MGATNEAFARAALAAIGGAPERGRLAGLYLWAGGDPSPSLRRAARQEAADRVLAERELARVLDALERFAPVVLKGLAVAARWPRPELRAPGDHDLLIEPGALDDAMRALAPLGYRAQPGDRGGRFRAPPTGAELEPPPGSHFVVDLHTRPFRTVGAALDGLWARARAATIAGRPARVLDDADELLYGFVHAAKHGVSEARWRVDLWALAAAADEPTWQTAIARARAAGATRPFWAAAQACARLPGARVPPFLAALAPRCSALTLRALDARGAGGDYARELLLEERWSRRARLVLGFFEKRIG